MDPNDLLSIRVPWETVPDGAEFALYLRREGRIVAGRRRKIDRDRYYRVDQDTEYTWNDHDIRFQRYTFGPVPDDLRSLTAFARVAVSLSLLADLSD